MVIGNQGQGLSASDLANRARVATLRRNGAPASDDPLALALADDRRVQANAITRRSIRELEAEEKRAEAQGRQAELDIIRSELERAKLERERTEMSARPDPDDGLKELLFGELQDLRGQLAGLKDSMTQAQMNELRERLNQLSAELVQARSAEPEGLEAIRAKVKEAQEIAAMTLPPPPVATGENAALEYARLRLEASREQHRNEMELRREDNQARRTQDRELRDRELSIQEAHYQRIDRFMGDTSPKLLALGQTLLQKLGGGGVVQPEAAAAVSPATQELHLAPGVLAAACESCGHTIYYRKDYPGLFCPNCTWEYRFTEQAAGDEAAPPVADEVAS